MRAELFTDSSAFARLAAEWDDLLARAVVPSIFLSYRWQSTWWHHFGNGHLLLIAVRDEANRLVGLAPLFCSQESPECVSFIGCVDVSDYLDFIVDRSCAEVIYQTLWEFVCSSSMPRWEALNLCNIPATSPTCERLSALAQAAGFVSSVIQESVCPVITLPESWEAYLASLDKKQRHEIRRKLRRAEESAEVRWYVLEQPDEVAAHIETFIELHQKSTAEKRDFWDARMIAFFRAISRSFAEAGWLKLYFIEFNGERAAAFMCFDYRDEILVYNSGYDPERFAWLSPGIVLNARIIEHAIQLGRRRLDFLRGDEEYKFRFGAVPEPVYRLRIERLSSWLRSEESLLAPRREFG
jgi:CelD/BcsL family acetyltransferase involved in cellulose biosynthesis